MLLKPIAFSCDEASRWISVPVVVDEYQKLMWPVWPFAMLLALVRSCLFTGYAVHFL